MLTLERDSQPSIGCDGHRAIAPSIVPEVETVASIADGVEFSPSHRPEHHQTTTVTAIQAGWPSLLNPHVQTDTQPNIQPDIPPESSPHHQPLTETATPAGWPSLLYPHVQTDVQLDIQTDIQTGIQLEPSHQSALPSPSDPRLVPGLETDGGRSLLFAPLTSRPQSGHQLYQQRWAALSAGKTYTRLPSDSFESQWKHASYLPTYEDWLYLLSREARSMAAGQGENALTVIVGDSLSLWMPTEFLSQHRFWLNQSISGETAAGMVKRLYMFNRTNPDTIHVMAGINDLKNGATDTEVLESLQTMMQQLRYQHPEAEVIIHSILPTRLPNLPSDRIHGINQRLVQITQQEGTTFLDLQGYFSDAEGHLRQDLTTDGLHLNYRGYTMWQAAIDQLS